jgi:hypothetical protein
MPYGQREYGLTDPEGHRWWFATPLSIAEPNQQNKMKDNTMHLNPISVSTANAKQRSSFTSDAWAGKLNSSCLTKAGPPPSIQCQSDG